MMLTTVFRTLCIGATLVVAQRGRDRDDKCWTCEQSSGCFECLGISDNGDGTAMIELDFSECKEADTIGWACCTGSMGPNDEFNQGACEVPPSGCFGKNNRSRDPEGGSVKCEGVSSMFLLVPSDATSVVINTHDGRTGNDASPAIGADPICAGREYQGGRCAARDNSITTHCLETIDLSTCPTMDSLPMTAVPTPSPSVRSEFPSDVPSSVMSGESDLPSLVPIPDESEED